MRNNLMAAVAAASILLVGCDPTEPAASGDHTTSHDYKAEHGGKLVHLKAHGPMMEVVHDAGAGTIKLFFYGSHHKEKAVYKAPIATVEDGPTTVTATGSGSVWTFAHDKLKGHPHVSFQLVVDGQKYTSDEWHAEEH